MTDVSVRRKEDTQDTYSEVHVKIGTEFGIVYLQDKE